MRKIRPAVRFGPRRRHKARCRPLPYEGRSSLLSQGELVFFCALRSAIGARYGVSLKTRLADVLSCPPELWDAAHGRRISQKHVDFVLYDPLTARIVAAVELDDRTHEQRDRRKRDAFLDQALHGAGVVLIRFRASSGYLPYAIRRQIEAAVTRR
jgi:Protein of unknown function (DUF2726)